MNLGLRCVTSRSMYEKINHRMEKLSKIVYFGVVGVTVPGFIIPKALVSYFKYFTTDLGADAFDLPMPTW